jgi:soluble lytic murein transglycosylase
MTAGVTAVPSGMRMRVPNWVAVCLLVGCLLGHAPGVAAAGDAPAESPEAVLAGASREVAAGNLGVATELLRRLGDEEVPAPVRWEADLLLGILLVRQDQHEEAVPFLQRAAATSPLLGDYALAYLATAHRRIGRPADAATSLRQLLDQHPKSLFIERASRNLPRDLLDAGDLPLAEETSGKYLAAFPNGAGRAEVWVTLGEILFRAGRTEQAEEVLRRVWVELPGNPESLRAKEILDTIPTARPFSVEEQFQRARTLYQLGRYGEALVELAPFAATGDPREAQARLLLGIAAFRARQYGHAVQWLEPMRDAAGAGRAETLFWLARGFGRMGDLAKFTEYMTRLADTAPETRWAEEGLYLLAQAAADDGEAGQARIYLTRLLREYPRSTWRDGARWLQGWLAFRDRDLKAALAAWDRLLVEEPGSRLKTPALYWRGRTLELVKKPREAVEAYRQILHSAADRDYYWFRARERLTRLGKKMPPPPALTDADGKRLAGSDTLRTKKARALRTLGLVEEAVEEYTDQIRTRPEDRGGLAEACRAFLDLQRYDKAVWLAGQILRPVFIQQNGLPPIREFWPCLYPLGYWPLVEEQARQQNLDPYLVAALIREESAFSPKAVSRAGARGLMQLMPLTAEQVARGHGMIPGSGALLEVPEVNVRLGTIHLGELLRDNGGSLTLTLAAYNAGSQQVRRWKERYSTADEEEFTENIPFTETRNYVKRVLGNYQRYSTLYTPRRADSAPLRGAERGSREPRVQSKSPGAGNKKPSAVNSKPKGERREPRTENKK